MLNKHRMVGSMVGCAVFSLLFFALQTAQN